ncbi:MAG: sigma-E processing peptidase SpoIIGA [Clostridiales bacterium]|nr:sigma-E processing peptidase SpoIIGA [Candidatus Cacconaster stercorequi]
MQVVYIDRVILLNALVDYLLLLSAARLCGRPLRRWRFLICAILGGIYAAAVFYFPWLAHPAAKLLSGTLMVWLAYRREIHPIRQMALFFLLSGGLAGILLGFGIAAGAPAFYLDRLTYAQISWPVLIISAVTFSILLQILFRQGARHGGKEIMDMIISIGGHSQSVRALHDTGNTLRDPISGRPVLVLEQSMLKELLPSEVWHILNSNIPPEEKMAYLHQQETPYCFTLLPFRSVGVASGLLLAIRSDYIQVERKRYSRTLIALSPGSISDGGGYQALWRAEEGEAERENLESAAGVAQKKSRAR